MHIIIPPPRSLFRRALGARCGIRPARPGPGRLIQALCDLCLCSAILPSLVLAQSTPTRTETDPKTVELDPLQVTASSNVGYGAQTAASSSRLNIAYIDVPQTISVVTSEFLKDSYIFDSRDMTKYVNNVSPRANAHQVETYYIRGLQVTQSYVDGYLAWRPVNRDSALYERIEYVKGPAAAAMGRGEAGGLINYITKKPQGVRRTELRATVATDNFYRAEIDYQDVLVKGVSARVAAYYEDSDGTRGGDLMHTEKYGVGPSLSWQFGNSSLEVNASLFKHVTPGSTASSPWMDKDLWRMTKDLGLVPNSVWEPGPTTPFVSHDVIFTFPGSFRDVEVAELNAIFTHRFSDAFSIRQGVNLGSTEEDYRRFSTPAALRRDPADPTRYQVSVTYLREARESSGIRAQGDALFHKTILKTEQDLLLGYDAFDSSGSFRSGSGPTQFQDLYAPSYILPANFNPEVLYTTDNEGPAKGYGYYLNYSGRYFRDRLNIIAGWRRDSTSSSTLNRRNGVTTSTNDVVTDVPRWSVSYKPVSWASIYFVHSEQADPPVTRNRYSGFRSVGGATLPPPSDPRYGELITSQLTGTLQEFGAKANLWKGRVTVSAAYFEMERDGAFLNVVRQEPGANGVGTVLYDEFFPANGENVKGFELELFGQPTERLTVYAGYSNTDGTRVRANGTVGNIDALPDTVTAHGKYSFRNAQGDGFELTGGVKVWFSGWTMDAAADTKFTRDQFSIDAGASYYWGHARYGAHLRVNNVTDEFVILTVNSQWGLRRAYLSFSATF